MTLREHCSTIKRQAHEVLDRVRAGVPVPDQLVIWALLQLGELA